MLATFRVAALGFYICFVPSAKEEIKTKNSDHTMEENYRKLLEAREKCNSLVDVYTRISYSLRWDYYTDT